MDGHSVQIDICHPDELPDEIRYSPGSGNERIVRKDGKIYLMLDTQKIIRCSDNIAGNELIYDLNLACRGDISRMTEREKMFYRILNDPECIPDADSLRKHRIDPDTHRCIAVFRSFGPIEKELVSVIRDIAPLEKSDILIPIDYRTVAFVRDLKMQSTDELKDYSEAVIGTMESEGITGIKAGIGSESDGIETLGKSYRDGMDALSVGMKTHPRSSVYLYTSQMLDRILDCIPEEGKQQIRKELFHRASDSILSGEMLETIRVFFQNDLNLTAASRQLFIHRNTLNYRLDKLKKETGLDLRSFEDAVIFRIVTGIQADR